MTSAAARPALQPLEMIESLTQCAYDLAVAACEIAKRSTGDVKLFLAVTTEYRHLSFAVRMGVRLAMAWQSGQPTRMGIAAAPSPRETSDNEPLERLDRDPSEHEPLERERDREYEPMSLPQFLKTLGLAAKRAEAHRDDLPAHIRDTTLPKLHDLLRQADASSAPSRAAATRSPTRGPQAGGSAPAALLARPPAAPAGRARLLGSSGAIGLPPLRPKPPRRPGSG